MSTYEIVGKQNTRFLHNGRPGYATKLPHVTEADPEEFSRKVYERLYRRHVPWEKFMKNGDLNEESGKTTETKVFGVLNNSPSPRRSVENKLPIITFGSPDRRAGVQCESMTLTKTLNIFGTDNIALPQIHHTTRSREKPAKEVFTDRPDTKYSLDPNRALLPAISESSYRKIPPRRYSLPELSTKWQSEQPIQRDILSTLTSSRESQNVGMFSGFQLPSPNKSYPNTEQHRGLKGDSRTKPWQRLNIKKRRRSVKNPIRDFYNKRAEALKELLEGKIRKDAILLKYKQDAQRVIASESQTLSEEELKERTQRLIKPTFNSRVRSILAGKSHTPTTNCVCDRCHNALKQSGLENCTERHELNYDDKHHLLREAGIFRNYIGSQEKGNQDKNLPIRASTKDKQNQSNEVKHNTKLNEKHKVKDSDKVTSKDREKHKGTKNTEKAKSKDTKVPPKTQVKLPHSDQTNANNRSKANTVPKKAQEISTNVNKSRHKFREEDLKTLTNRLAVPTFSSRVPAILVK